MDNHIEVSLADYDVGYRRGVFDKCNGLEARFMADEGNPFICGYLDAYNGNEVVIARPTVNVVIAPREEIEVYRLWLEGDYGQDEYIYATEELAKANATDLIKAQYGGEGDYQTFEEMENDGLASIQPLTFIS